MKKILVFPLLAVCAFIYQIKENFLSTDEKKEGWQLLFDGKSIKGWHVFRKPGSLSPQWIAENGTMVLAKSGGGDLVTDEEFENFELNLDWKISQNGNSGIFFNVSESTEYKAVYETGPEMQILDDMGHEDGKFPKHTAGSNYDLSEPLVKSVKPAGQWNHVRLIVNQGNVTHYLNGQITAKYKLWTPEWEALVKASKFKDMQGYGQIHKGHIALQDHGDQVWFKNIKIKRL